MPSETIESAMLRRLEEISFFSAISLDNKLSKPDPRGSRSAWYDSLEIETSQTSLLLSPIGVCCWESLRKYASDEHDRVAVAKVVKAIERQSPDLYKKEPVIDQRVPRGTSSPR
jgi:hypothetical protein